LQDLRSGKLDRNDDDTKKAMKRWKNVKLLKERAEIEKEGHTYSPYILLDYTNYKELWPADPMHLFGGTNIATTIC
jgi:hypothetical protein